MLKFKLKLNWKITLFSILLLPLLISLGFWQLSRADEKREIQSRWLSLQSMPPEAFSPEKMHESFRRIEVKGEFDFQRYWLLENQILEGRQGYHVIMPFLTGETVLLVNRGWVPAGKYREDNPAITTPSTPIRLVGTLVEPSDSPMIEQSQLKTGWPARILEIDNKVLSAQYGENIFAKVLRIDVDNRAAFDVHWRPINMSDKKHIGYAVQWFAMALALFILWIFANSNLMAFIKRNSTQSKYEPTSKQ